MTDEEKQAIQTFVDVVMGVVVSTENPDCHCFNCRIYRQFERLKKVVPWVK